MSSEQQVETYFDPSGTIGERRGCFKARLARNHGIWDAGRTLKQAKQEFVTTAASFGMPDNLGNYCFKNIGERCDNPDGSKEIAGVLPWHLTRLGAP